MARHRSDLPAALAAALDERRLAILAGAGISIWSPSSLPGWTAFNDIVLDEVRRLAAGAAPDALKPEIHSLTLDEIGSKNFSDALVNDLMGSTYFEIVRSLDARRPNSVHHAIAALSARRRLRAIVTTNFDTLIEKAFQAARRPLAVMATPADYVKEQSSDCILLKIHGSATRGDGLIDTVRQKMRGLHQLVRARIAGVVANNHVLVLGFSGDDLGFGADYLALRSVRASSPGLTWVVRPGTEPSALVRKVVARAGGRGTIAPVDLGDFLERITGQPLKLSLDEAGRREAESQVRTVARQVLGGRQSLNALAFCMRLLAMVGHIDAAAAVWRYLASTIHVGDAAHHQGLGAALRAMAAEAPLLAGPSEQATWAQAALGRLTRPNGAAPGAKDDAMTDDDRRAAATAYTHLAEALTQVGNPDSGVAMEEAMNHAEWLCDVALLSGIYSTYGWRAAFRTVQTSEDDEEALAWLFAAEAAALIGGNIEAANAALRRSEILIRVGEYDTALACILRLERRVDLGVRREMYWEAEIQKGQIELRRGRVEPAVKRWQACADRYRQNRVAVAGVHAIMISHLGFSPDWRRLVVQLAEGMVAAMNAGTLPADGRLRSIATRAYYDHVVKALAALTEAFPPFFVRHEGAARDALEDIRRDLIAAEYRGDAAAVLRSFESLVAEYYNQGRVERMLEAALAQRVRARRDGNADRRFRASANVAAARYWTGDRPAAASLYARLYADPAAKRRSRYWGGLGRRLPSGFWGALPASRAVVPHATMWSRRFTLDGFAALENKRGQPATLRHLGDLARDAVEAREFGMGRIYLFELAAGCKAIGDREGESRAYEMLAEAAETENRYRQADVLRARATQQPRN